MIVLVSNNNIYIDIKLYFCFVYRSILKYRVIDVFGESFSSFPKRKQIWRFRFSGK